MIKNHLRYFLEIRVLCIKLYNFSLYLYICLNFHMQNMCTSVINLIFVWYNFAIICCCCFAQKMLVYYLKRLRFVMFFLLCLIFYLSHDSHTNTAYYCRPWRINRSILAVLFWISLWKFLFDIFDDVGFEKLANALKYRISY